MSIEFKKYLSVVRIVSTFYPQVGGAGIHVMELTKKINPFFSSQLIISPDCSYDCSSFDNNFVVPIIRVDSKIAKNKYICNLPGTNLLNELFYSYNAAAAVMNLILNGRSIDLIYVHNMICGIFYCFFSKAFHLNIPIVIMHHHGRPLYSGKIKIRGLMLNLIILFMIFFFRPAHYIQLNDGILDKTFLHFLKLIRLNFTVVNHAIDINIYNTVSNLRNEENFIILSPHRLDSFKRIDLTIQSFKIFLDKISPNHSKKKPCLKIIGSGPLLDDLKQLAKKFEIFEFIIFENEKSHEDIVYEMISSDVIVGTSLVSNMNLSILEAMSLGKPVLVFGNSIYNDLFLNMENSVLIDFGDTIQFAEKLKLLYDDDDLRDRIGKNAEISIESRRNWILRINQELKVCDDIFSEISRHGPQL